MTIMNIIISERSTEDHKQIIKFNKKLARELYEVSSTWFAYLRVLGGNWGVPRDPEGSCGIWVAFGVICKNGVGSGRIWKRLGGSEGLVGFGGDRGGSNMRADMRYIVVG